MIRPNRQARRRRGKSDAADAVAAAVAALSGEASGMPQSRDGAAESIRALKVARAGAVKARTQAGNQLRDLILTAPEPVRQQLAGLSCPRQMALPLRTVRAQPAMRPLRPVFRAGRCVSRGSRPARSCRPAAGPARPPHSCTAAGSLRPMQGSAAVSTTPAGHPATWHASL